MRNGWSQTRSLQNLENNDRRTNIHASTRRVTNHITEFFSGMISNRWQMPKLPTKQRIDSTRGILLVAHFRHEKEVKTLLGRSAEQNFLDRHHVQSLCGHQVKK